MNNSGVCVTSYNTSAANILAAKGVTNLHSYSTSVTRISEMFNQVRRASFKECAELQTPPASGPTAAPSTTTEDPRAFPIFKNSHACGSLYAKCGCNNENNITASVPQAHSSNSVPPPSKCSSNPSASEEHSSKRLSNPDINNSSQHKRRTSLKSLPKGSEYLNHPEIPYPIPLIPREKRRSSEKTVVNLESKIYNQKPNNNFYTELICNKFENNLEYLRYTAIAHKNLSTIALESDRQAQKFLKESGIIGPMGNGAPTPIRKNSKNAVIELDPSLQSRRNSKIMSVDPRKRHSSVPDDYEYLKTVVVHLKRELSDLEVKYGSLQTELIHRTKELHCRESEVLQLQREVHKLKSVLQQATCFSNERDILSSLQEEHGMANRVPIRQQSLTACCNKKQGVSAESSDTSVQPNAMALKKYDKDFRSKQQIKDAIMDNNFLKHLDSLQVREIIDSMYSKSFEEGSYVIREGEAGAHLYVSAQGDFDVIKDDKVLGRMGPGKAFGELAVLYNCTRTASIRVNGSSKVWVLDRKVFQQIMVRTGLQRLQDNINFLRSVPLLQNLNNDVLAKIADVLEVEFYPAGAYIIRQCASGDTFFIISSGSVKVTQRLAGRLEEEEIRTLQRGEYFGEQALLREECRTASVIALSPGVECLTLDRESFIQLIGDLSELKEKDYGDQQRALSRPSSSISVGENNEYDYIKLDDLDVVGTLGIGGFGRVELVQYTFDKNLTFALKCLKKQHIVDTQQQEHILSEKIVMMSCRSSFICRLFRTYRDTKYVYMLLEPCLGGEVWTMLRDRGCFDDHATRFVTACVIEAFDYLHTRGVIYRDLKPENLLLDTKGFIKIVDFGFSKRLGYSSKTWTFCGTPEYVAPETILNKGHDRAVDYWALGILMYELLTGSPPFTAADPMKTYNLILKGIDMVDFENHLNIGRSAQSLIKKLCRDLPSERLGYQRGGIQDIKKHKWFQGFDWDGLKAHTIISPIRQPIRGPCDTSNFDCFSKDNDIPPDEFTDWDIDF